MSLRSFAFWCHLLLALVFGSIIVLMAATGLLLTYERQILHWAERGDAGPPPDADAAPLPVDELLARLRVSHPDFSPATMTWRATAHTAVVINGGATVLRVNPYSGAVVPEPAPQLRAFFRSVTNWHRWLALEGESRLLGRSVTGASNLAFLVVIATGLVLWWPRQLAAARLQAVLWFRRGLSGRARDFNWHNAIGIWVMVPLFLIVLGATVISYPWASDLVYRAAGEAPPPRQRPPAPGPTSVDVDGAGVALAAARTMEPHWSSLTLRVPVTSGTATVTVDSGLGGQPQKRSTVDVSVATGAITRIESFDVLSRGRRTRTWLRFVHTGEYYGILGQTVAGAASLGAVFLGYTGVALALRRFSAWLQRRQRRGGLSQAA